VVVVVVLLLVATMVVPPLGGRRRVGAEVVPVVGPEPALKSKARLRGCLGRLNSTALCAQAHALPCEQNMQTHPWWLPASVGAPRESSPNAKCPSSCGLCTTPAVDTCLAGAARPAAAAAVGESARKGSPASRVGACRHVRTRGSCGSGSPASAAAAAAAPSCCPSLLLPLGCVRCSISSQGRCVALWSPA
jgi:hypothetical protein